MNPLTRVGLGYVCHTGLTLSLGIGLADIFLNHRVPDSVPGHGTSEDDKKHPAATTLGSLVRSVGSSWRGYAICLWWIGRDPEHREAPLAFLGVVMILGGLGRVASAVYYGVTDPYVLVATAAELAAPVLAYSILAPSKHMSLHQ